MLFRTVAVAAASLAVALALPTYTIPQGFLRFLALDTCTYPENPFEIQNFTIWTPAAGSNASMTIDFAYLDESTRIETSCHYNATSQNVARPEITPRYACDNTDVEFIWQNGKLTMIEAACPEDASGFEAAGSAAPVLDCVATTCGYTYGDGNMCRVSSSFQGNFTSLQPTPK